MLGDFAQHSLGKCELSLEIMLALYLMTTTLIVLLFIFFV